MNAPIIHVIDQLNRETAERYKWLTPVSEQVRRWKREDELTGEPWGECRSRGTALGSPEGPEPDKPSPRFACHRLSQEEE